MLNSANDMHTLGTAKTLMEIAFRTVALTRYADSDNALIQRGQEGIVAALERLDQEIKEQGLESLLSDNLATLYLHVALDYVQFRHTELFDEVNSCTIIDFLHLSPFADVLTRISIESLANKPDYETLLDSFGLDI